MSNNNADQSQRDPCPSKFKPISLDGKTLHGILAPVPAAWTQTKGETPSMIDNLSTKLLGVAKFLQGRRDEPDVPSPTEDTIPPESYVKPKDNNRRGDYHSINVGISFGGGQPVSQLSIDIDVRSQTTGTHDVGHAALLCPGREVSAFSR